MPVDALPLDPRQRVDELAAFLGFSDRQLRRRFLAATGSEGFAGAAAAAGYADQAHLARECRALTGLTAAQLADSRR